MTVDQFLKDELESIIVQDIQDDERKMLQLGQRKYFIEQRLLSKKFRKNFLQPETRELIKKKIALSADNDKPLYLIFAFGGYKNPWVESAYPNPEWAELFHLIYILKLLTPIAKHYEPGIFLQYESECEATIYHNNFSKEDVNSYTENFKKLLEFIKPYAPKNIEFSYITLPEQYDTDKFFEGVKTLVPERVEELRKSLGAGLKDALKRPKFNLKLDGVEDLTSKSEEELDEIALRSLAFNHLFLEEDYKIREGFFYGDERISMVGTYCSEEENPDNWIEINSCARSANAFWTSRGVLIETAEGYQMDIVGPVEYGKLKESIKMEETQIISEVVPNMGKIPVVSR